MRWNAPEDFQTRPHLPAQTDDLFVSVMIRGFRRVALACGSGSGPIETHDSVRVKFESTRAVRTARIERRSTDRPTRVQIPNGNRTGLADVFSSLACFVLLATPMRPYSCQEFACDVSRAWSPVPQERREAPSKTARARMWNELEIAGLPPQLQKVRKHPHRLTSLIVRFSSASPRDSLVRASQVPGGNCSEAEELASLLERRVGHRARADGRTPIDDTAATARRGGHDGSRPARPRSTTPRER